MDDFNLMHHAEEVLSPDDRHLNAAGSSLRPLILNDILLLSKNRPTLGATPGRGFLFETGLDRDIALRELSKKARPLAGRPRTQETCADRAG